MRSAAEVAENVPPAFEALDQHVERVVGIRNHVGVPGTARVLRRWRPRGLRRLLPDSSALPKLASRMSCAYGRATPSTTFEVKMDSELLTIGELAQRTGVARSALRYYEELDILRPNDRRSGQRRYDEAAVAVVGAILLLQEVGFSLNQIRQIMCPGSASGSAAWRNLAASKVKDLDDRIKRAEAARSALQHALAHHHDDVLDCSRFWDAVTNRLQGVSLQASHPHSSGLAFSPRGFGQDAGHRRPQVQRLPVDADEASLAKPPGRLLTDTSGCLGGGTGTARLRDNRHPTARPQRPAKFRQPRRWFGPHPEVVDSQRLVEHLAEITRSTADPSRNSTRPCSTAARLRTAAWRTMISEWSIPSTKPSVARRASSWIPSPGPKPISRMWS